MSKPIVDYRDCEHCGSEMPIYKYYEGKRFCSAKCRYEVLAMPPRPDRTGSTPWNKGIKWPELAEKRMGEGNPNWKGDKIKDYSALHTWVRSRKPKPLDCESCGQRRTLQLSNSSYEYSRDLSDWEYLCVPCHSKKDRASGHWGEATKKWGLH